MTCNRTRLRDLGRKKYPVGARTLPRYQFISNKNIEIENVIIEFLDSDTSTLVFDKPFSGIPSVVANFVSVGSLPSVNLFVESILTDKVVIRTSAPVTGQVHVHAMYIES